MSNDSRYLNGAEQKIILFWLIFFLTQTLILYLLFKDRFQKKWFPVVLMLYILYNIFFLKMITVNDDDF